MEWTRMFAMRLFTVFVCAYKETTYNHHGWREYSALFPLSRVATEARRPTDRVSKMHSHTRRPTKQCVRCSRAHRAGLTFNTYYYLANSKRTGFGMAAVNAS